MKGANFITCTARIRPGAFELTGMGRCVAIQTARQRDLASIQISSKVANQLPEFSFADF
jgi:hypothetical protein